MNGPIELPGKSLPGFPADKTRGKIAQVFEDRPEEFLSHLGRPDFVRVGKIIATGWSRSSQAGQWTGMQAKRITHIIDPNAVSQLRKQQRDDVTPSTKGADFLLDSRFSGEFWNQEVWNEVAYLPQQIQLRRSWDRFAVIFHPCRVAGLNKPFQLFLQFPMGWL